MESNLGCIGNCVEILVFQISKSILVNYLLLYVCFCCLYFIRTSYSRNSYGIHVHIRFCFWRWFVSKIWWTCSGLIYGPLLPFIWFVFVSCNILFSTLELCALIASVLSSRILVFIYIILFKNMFICHWFTGRTTYWIIGLWSFIRIC